MLPVSVSIPSTSGRGILELVTLAETLQDYAARMNLDDAKIHVELGIGGSHPIIDGVRPALVSLPPFCWHYQCAAQRQSGVRRRDGGWLGFGLLGGLPNGGFWGGHDRLILTKRITTLRQSGLAFHSGIFVDQFGVTPPVVCQHFAASGFLERCDDDRRSRGL